MVECLFGDLFLSEIFRWILFLQMFFILNILMNHIKVNIRILIIQYILKIHELLIKNWHFTDGTWWCYEWIFEKNEKLISILIHVFFVLTSYVQHVTMAMTILSFFLFEKKLVYKISGINFFSIANFPIAQSVRKKVFRGTLY